MYELSYAAYYGHYRLEDAYYLSVGQTMEDFETGDFTSYDWHQGSIITAWEIVTQNPYAGQYCAKSASIGDYETSSLSITLQISQESEVSFYYKVSSEANYDKLHFYIDNTEKANWSGEVAWTRAVYSLPAGEHNLKWEYTKDVSLSSGSDCAWIDNIVFPPTQVITMTEEVTHNVPVIYPNPNKGHFSINLPEEECEIMVFNSLGQVMYRESKASGLITLDLTDLPEGMYFVNIKNDSVSNTQKFIKE
jgi:hypothetical protein